MFDQRHVQNLCSSCHTSPHEPESILCEPCQHRLVWANRLLRQWQQEQRGQGQVISDVEQSPITERAWTADRSDETVGRWDKVNAQQGGSLDLDVLIDRRYAKARTER